MQTVLDTPVGTFDSASSGEKAGVYLLPKLRIERADWVGSPVLTLNLAVNATNGDLMGRGGISQSVTPPAGNSPIPTISGKLVQTGFPEDQRLLHITGRYAIPFGPTMPGQIEARMSAAFVIDEAGNGRGTFSYGPNAEHVLTDCTVTAVVK